MLSDCSAAVVGAVNMDTAVGTWRQPLLGAAADLITGVRVVCVL